MTTDRGIDLVAYSPKNQRAITIQVKSTLQPKPAGGKGRMALDWWLNKENPTELVALTCLSTDQAWLFKHEEFRNTAQQESNGKLHFYFSTDPDARSHKIADFNDKIIDHRIEELFGSARTP